MATSKRTFFKKLPKQLLFSDIAKKVNAIQSLLIPKRTLSAWVSEM